MDTHPVAERIQVELLRRAGVARRAVLARSLSQSVILLARRAIQRARPGADEQEVLLVFVAVHYGRQLADRLRDRLARGLDGTR